MLSSVASHEFLYCARERERFAKRRSLAHFHDHACDASRRRFFAQLTKEAGQSFFSFIIFAYSRRGGPPPGPPPVPPAPFPRKQTPPPPFSVARGKNPPQKTRPP